MEDRRNRVLILGGTGNIGRELVSHLKTRGFEITLLSRHGGGGSGPNVKIVKYYISNEELE